MVAVPYRSSGHRTERLLSMCDPEFPGCLPCTPLVVMEDAKTGPHLSSSASPRVSPCENRWLDGRRRCTLRGGLGGNRPRFRKGSTISDGAGGSAGMPAGRTPLGATPPIRPQQALKKHRRRVGWGAETSGREGSWLGQTGAGGAVHRAVGGGREVRITPSPSRRALEGDDNLYYHCIQRRRFSCGKCSPVLGHLGSVPTPYCHQIPGVVRAVSCRGDIRQGTFPGSLVPLEAVGTAHMSHPKPVRGAVGPADRRQRGSHLRFARHPVLDPTRSPRCVSRRPH